MTRSGSRGFQTRRGSACKGPVARLFPGTLRGQLEWLELRDGWWGILDEATRVDKYQPTLESQARGRILVFISKQWKVFKRFARGDLICIL